MKFTLEKSSRETNARTGKLDFPYRNVTIPTPAFMPVGTRATVKSLSQEELTEIGYQLILANTYHCELRPGSDLIRDMGGLHKFMSFPGVFLTDSGGFQIFSLAKLTKFREDGVEFRSHIDGSKLWFTPERVIDIQKNLASDIMMILDDCPPWPADPDRLEQSMKRTLAWAKVAESYSLENVDKSKQAVFAIVQGGLDKKMRDRCVEEICQLDFDSYAIGGLSVGEPRPLFDEILMHTAPQLPSDKPRYLMGVGTIRDLLIGVKAGVDMFDCVLPTRNARRGQVFTSTGKKNLRNLQYARLESPIDENCCCRVCQKYSLGYLRHLFHVGEFLAIRLASYHNLAFIHSFMSLMRESIQDDQFGAFYDKWMEIYLED